MNGSKGYLLDTNAISETEKPRPNPTAVAFIRSVSAQSYLSVLTIGELRRGDFQKRRRHPEMTNRYTAWIDAVEAAYDTRILPIDTATASLWGQLSAGRTLSVVDSLLAATAIFHNLTLVTRNVKDIADLPVRILNPWQS